MATKFIDTSNTYSGRRLLLIINWQDPRGSHPALVFSSILGIQKEPGQTSSFSFWNCRGHLKRNKKQFIYQLLVIIRSCAHDGYEWITTM